MICHNEKTFTVRLPDIIYQVFSPFLTAGVTNKKIQFSRLNLGESL